jgi:hypothetical protein
MSDERRQRAQDKFNCNHCAGSGAVMVGRLTSDVCPTCAGSGCKKSTVREIDDFAQSEVSLALENAAGIAERFVMEFDLPDGVSARRGKTAREIAAKIRELAAKKGK